MRRTQDRRGSLSEIFELILNTSSLYQDMQICANELMKVMKNVLAKREYTVKIKGERRRD